MQTIHGGDIYRNRIQIDFSVNINPLGIPEEVKDALHQAVDVCMQYPDMEAEQLKEALSRKFCLPKTYFLPGNGASGIFFVNSEQNNNAMKKIWAYILPTALCFVLGGLAGWLQQDAIEEWYPLLDKPTLTPPNAVFPIAWSIIYLCMGISGGLVLTSEAPARKSAVRLWFLQLGCNFLWSILFFVCRSPLLGMADIVVLDVLVILYLVRSANVRAAAAWLFVPYLCWILFATYLNAYILVANGTGL